MKILISKNKNIFVSENDFELVERKGIGHPDTICDSIAERASRNYEKYCINTFGRPAHHWFDKVMLIGGEANIDYGIGEIVKPYTIIFAGKVSYYVQGQKIPVDTILYDSSAEVLQEVLTGFIPECHMKIVNNLVDYQGSGRKNSRYRPESIDELPELGDSSLVSNDSNLVSAYAPLTILEKLVLGVEHFINGKEFKKNNPDTGWDVKLFGRRIYDKYELLVNMPFLAKDILSLEDYFKRKQEVFKEIEEYIYSNFDIKNCKLTMNATDRNGLPYLTALGTVADTGDVGVVGRGNRLNGLITPMRPMSIEAPAGKNPIDHTGKLYGILAKQIADEIYEYLKTPIDVHIYTAKESQLCNPDEVIIKLSEYNADEEIKKNIEKIIKEKVENVGEISRKIIFKGIDMW